MRNMPARNMPDREIESELDAMLAADALASAFGESLYEHDYESAESDEIPS
jgi:hypothetical protein